MENKIELNHLDTINQTVIKEMSLEINGKEVIVQKESSFWEDNYYDSNIEITNNPKLTDEELESVNDYINDGDNWD